MRRSRWRAAREGRTRPRAGTSEVVGGLLMLTLALMAFLLLAHAFLEQARQTAEYIRGLVPEGAPGEEEACVTMPDERVWCRQLPRGPPGDEPDEVCVRDSKGWEWCLQPQVETPSELPLP